MYGADTTLPHAGRSLRRPSEEVDSLYETAWQRTDDMRKYITPTLVLLGILKTHYTNEGVI